MKILVFNAKPYEKNTFESLEHSHALSFQPEQLGKSNAKEASGFDAVSVFTNDDVSAPVLEELAELGVKAVLLRCAGFNNVDLDKAKELGIQVGHVPEYSPHSVAEFVVTLILALNRNIIRGQEKVKQYNFTLDDLIGFDMNTRTVGIVGLGKIGETTAEVLSGFGCRIIGYDVQDRSDLEEKGLLEMVDLDTLYKEADIISLHVPLNKHTKYMINKETIEKMKDDVMIINTSRGGVICTEDLIEAIKEDKVGSVGLDVYEKEAELFFYDRSNQILKDDLFARLLTFKNVIITDHQGFLTTTALENIMETTLDNASAFENNEPCPNDLTA